MPGTATGPASRTARSGMSSTATAIQVRRARDVAGCPACSRQGKDLTQFSPDIVTAAIDQIPAGCAGRANRSVRTPHLPWG
jgi:hypothetical protein